MTSPVFPAQGASAVRQQTFALSRFIIREHKRLSALRSFPMMASCELSTIAASLAPHLNRGIRVERATFGIPYVRDQIGVKSRTICDEVMRSVVAGFDGVPACRGRPTLYSVSEAPFQGCHFGCHFLALNRGWSSCRSVSAI